MSRQILKRNLCALVCIGLLALLAGCGSSTPAAPEMVPVSGKLTVAGKPLRAGTVVFMPNPEDPQRAHGQAPVVDGRFSLTSTGKQGIAAGNYVVLVYVGKPQPSDDAPFQRRYSLVEESPLHVEVTPSTPAENYNFDLAAK